MVIYDNWTGVGQESTIGHFVPRIATTADSSHLGDVNVLRLPDRLFGPGFWDGKIVAWYFIVTCRYEKKAPVVFNG